MRVYCVITETEVGVDLAGVYTNLEAAKNHVKQRYKTEFQNYITCGYHLREDDQYSPPSDSGAEIYLHPNDFWIWRIEEGEVKNTCQLNSTM